MTGAWFAIKRSMALLLSIKYKKKWDNNNYQGDNRKHEFTKEIGIKGEIKEEEIKKIQMPEAGRKIIRFIDRRS